MTGEVTSRSTCVGSSVGGISGIGTIEPKQSHAAQMSKTDEIEIQVLDQTNEQQPAEVKVCLFIYLKDENRFYIFYYVIDKILFLENITWLVMLCSVYMD